jgi:hypothetical protein
MSKDSDTAQSQAKKMLMFNTIPSLSDQLTYTFSAEKENGAAQTTLTTATAFNIYSLHHVQSNVSLKYKCKANFNIK